ncbi:hypothetical protein [Microbacterium aurum]
MHESWPEYIAKTAYGPALQTGRQSVALLEESWQLVRTVEYALDDIALVASLPHAPFGMGEAKRMPPPVLLPDTNVWVYLVDAGAVEILRKEAKRLGVTIAACPAVVYECLRAKLDPAAKKSRVDALTRGAWRRLMPEAYKESLEAFQVIKRARPDWVEPAPDLRRWMQIRADWDHGWWMRARRDTQAEAERIQLMDASDLDVTRSAAATRRQNARDAEITFDNIDFDVVAVPLSRPPWWDGQPVEPWRVEVATVLRHALAQANSPYRDWLSPWLRPSAVDEADWFRLWTRDATREEMPLAWLRWAFEHVQATRTTTNGTPVDNQIATYLPECDAFATSDKAFAECVEKVRPLSPVPLGRGCKVPAHEDAADALVDLMRDMAR